MRNTLAEKGLRIRHWRTSSQESSAKSEREICATALRHREAYKTCSQKALVNGCKDLVSAMRGAADSMSYPSPRRAFYPAATNVKQAG